MKAINVKIDEIFSDDDQYFQQRMYYTFDDFSDPYLDSVFSILCTFEVENMLRELF